MLRLILFGVLGKKTGGRPRTSPIWRMPRASLAKIVAEASSVGEVLRVFGLHNKGNNYKTLYARLDADGISYAHLPRGLSANRGRKYPGRGGVPLAEVMVSNSSYSRASLRCRLIQAGVLPYLCAVCGAQPSWPPFRHHLGASRYPVMISRR